MSNTDLQRRLDKAHQLTAELRQLQDQMNRTIEQLCELVHGTDIGRALVVPKAENTAEGERETTCTPTFLTAPVLNTYVRNPPTGHAISADARLYSNYRSALIQVLQQPNARQADNRYNLVLNYADFDGDLLSVVVDARSLLEGQPAGKARVSVAVEAMGNQQSALYAKCAWKAGKKWTERTFEIRPNQLSVASFDIEHLDCPNIQALDVHLLFNPMSRGSVEIRRMTASLAVSPSAEVAVEPSSIFENLP